MTVKSTQTENIAAVQGACGKGIGIRGDAYRIISTRATFCVYDTNNKT
jgi:hypothetical protein